MYPIDVKRQKDDLNTAKKQILPKSINLHSMDCMSVSFNSNPTFDYFANGDHMVRSENVFTLELKDVANDMDITITVRKPKTEYVKI